MRNIIDYISIIEINLYEFNYVIVEVQDYKGKLYQIRFDKTQDIVKKCEHMAMILGDGNRVLNMKCKY